MMMMMVATAMAMRMTMMMMVVAVMPMMMIARPLPEELAMVSKESTRMFHSQSSGQTPSLPPRPRPMPVIHREFRQQAGVVGRIKFELLWMSSFAISQDEPLFSLTHISAASILKSIIAGALPMCSERPYDGLRCHMRIV